MAIPHEILSQTRHEAMTSLLLWASLNFGLRGSNLHTYLYSKHHATAAMCSSMVQALELLKLCFVPILYSVATLQLPPPYTTAETGRLPLPSSPMVPAQMPGSVADSAMLHNSLYCDCHRRFTACHTWHCQITNHLVPISLLEIKSLLYCHLP